MDTRKNSFGCRRMRSEATMLNLFERLQKAMLQFDSGTALLRIHVRVDRSRRLELELEHAFARHAASMSSCARMHAG